MPNTGEGFRAFALSWFGVLRWAALGLVVGTALVYVIDVVAVLFEPSLVRHGVVDTKQFNVLSRAWLTGEAGPDPFSWAAVAAMGHMIAFVGSTAWLFCRFAGGGSLRSHMLTQRTSMAVVGCARAHQSAGSERLKQLRSLDVLIRAVEWQLWRAAKWRGGVTRRSPRHAAHVRHAALVVGALRRDVDRLSGSSEETKVGLEQLVTTLATIGERHAAGDITHLLPPEQLAGVTAASRRSQAVRESLTVVRAIAAALVAACLLDVVLPHTGISDSLAPWVLVGGAVMAAVAAAGGWHRVREFLGAFPLG